MSLFYYISILALASAFATISVEGIACYQETIFGPNAKLPGDAAVVTGCKYCSVTKFTMSAPSMFVRVSWACETGAPKSNCPHPRGCGNQNNNDYYGGTEEQCADMWHAFEADGIPQVSCQCCGELCNKDFNCGIDLARGVLGQGQDNNCDPPTTPAPVIQLDPASQAKCMEQLSELTNVCDALSYCQSASQQQNRGCQQK